MPYGEGSERSSAGRPPQQPIPGRRTVTIRGQVADRRSPRMVEIDRRRPSRTARERAMSRPDRVALWAVLLCLLLVVVAAASAHAAVPPHHALTPLIHVSSGRR